VNLKLIGKEMRSDGIKASTMVVNSISARGLLRLGKTGETKMHLKAEAGDITFSMIMAL
jgi:hypothetical protein